MSLALLAATAAAGFLYIVSPGPAFLAVFALAAQEGRGAGARFVAGHLVGDVLWGALALAAIVGVSQIGAAVFDALGLACGAFLIWLGVKAVFSPGGGAVEPVGKRRPLATGVAFGLTNPKAYPVSLAMFTALTASLVADIGWGDAPALMAAAFVGFLAGNVVLVFSAGLPAVRRFFLRHGAIVTRGVGLMFIAFGAKSIGDAATSLSRRN
jgi:threonine/homoserine/homoserine lactone efflux protein